MMLTVKSPGRTVVVSAWTGAIEEEEEFPMGGEAGAPDAEGIAPGTVADPPIVETDAPASWRALR